jgi:hypothetical protein
MAGVRLAVEGVAIGAGVLFQVGTARCGTSIRFVPGEIARFVHHGGGALLDRRADVVAAVGGALARIGEEHVATADAARVGNETAAWCGGPDPRQMSSAAFISCSPREDVPG